MKRNPPLLELIYRPLSVAGVSDSDNPHENLVKPDGSDALTAALCNWVDQAFRDSCITAVEVVLRLDDAVNVDLRWLDQVCMQLREFLNTNWPLSVRIELNSAQVRDSWIPTLARSRLPIWVVMQSSMSAQVGGNHQVPVFDAQALSGLSTLQRAFAHDLIACPGVIHTIDLSSQGAATYQYLTKDLGVRTLRLELPRDSHLVATAQRAQLLTTYLSQMLSEWRADSDKYRQINLFGEYLEFLSMSAGGADAKIVGPLPQVRAEILGSGSICMPIEYSSVPGADACVQLQSVAAVEWLSRPIGRFQIEEIWNTSSPACQGCAWLGFCRGGAQHRSAYNRYHWADGFKNKSVFCESLSSMYLDLTAIALQSGISQSNVLTVLECAKAGVAVPS